MEVSKCELCGEEQSRCTCPACGICGKKGEVDCYKNQHHVVTIPFATVKEGWSLGQPPSCPTCGVPMIAIAADDDGLFCYWSCDEHMYEGITIPWPFTGGRIDSNMFRALGFRLE